MPKASSQARALQGRGARRTWTLLALLLASAGVCAQSGLRINGRLATTLQVSDDFGGVGTQRDGGAVLTVAPGVVAVARTASLRGSLDYSLNALQSWRYRLPGERLQHALRSTLQWSPADTGFLLDGQATISSQSLSTLDGQRAPGSPAFAGNVQGNQREVYSLALGPSWSAAIGSELQFRIAHRLQANNTRGSLAGDATSQTTSMSLGTAGVRRLGASLQLSSSSNRAKGQPKSKTDSAFVRATWIADADWTFGARVGHERSNLQQSAVQQSGATYGLDVSWQPNPRTRVVLDANHRVFGDTHTLSIEHRLRRSTFRYTESRSVVLAGGSVGLSNYDFWFQQFEGREPDPSKRDVLVRAFLRDQGLSPEAPIGGGFINSSTSLSRARSLSASWQGVRTSLSTVLASTDGDALGGGGADQRSRTLAFNLGYRLTPQSSLALALSESSGNTALAGSFGTASDLKSISLNWSTSLGPQRQFSLQLRHSDSESTLRSYTENALFATLVQQF